MNAMIWLDDMGGVLYKRYRRRWYEEIRFSWDEVSKLGSRLIKHQEVTLYCALSGERLIEDSMPQMRWWDKSNMIKSKVLTHFPDMPYTAGRVIGRLNALQQRLCGIALPTDQIESVLLQIEAAEGLCRAIIPIAGIFARVARSHKVKKVLWVVLNRQMHFYFTDEEGVRFSRTVEFILPEKDLLEEVKKIYRYLVGQKYVGMKETLQTVCQIFDKKINLDNLPLVPGIQWKIEPVNVSITAFLLKSKSHFNCLSPILSVQNQWHCWNQRAWYGVALLSTTLLLGGGIAGIYYYSVWQALTQLEEASQHIKNQTTPLNKTAQTLLAIEAYRQQALPVDPEDLLLLLSHILAEFSLWHLDSIEWRRDGSMQLIGIWNTSEDTHQLNMRLERALLRRLKAKMITIHSSSEKTSQTQITIDFVDREVE